MNLTNVLFQSTLVEKSNIELSSDLTAEEKEEGISALSLDGCVIEELGLDFTLPGHAHVELRKDGRDIPVTIHNLAQYCKVSSSVGFCQEDFPWKNKSLVS